MKINELKKQLENMNIYSGLYSLDGTLLPDRIVLYHNYSKWEVFYFDERGSRHSEKIFLSEDDACNYIYEIFKNKNI